MTRLIPLLEKDSGGILIEATFGIMIVLIVTLGIIEFTRALYADIFIGYAAHAASRYAGVRGATWNPTNCSATMTSNCMAASSDITQFVKSLAPLGVDTSSNLTVASAWPGTSASGGPCLALSGPASPGCIVQVQITYNFQFAVPFVSQNPFLMRSSSAVTISQ